MRTKTALGFTLAELLITVSVIAILATLVLLSMNPFTYFKRAYDTERQDDLRHLKVALEDYYADHEYYPDLKNILPKCGGSDLQPYLRQIPCDPNTNIGYTVYTLPEGSTKPQQYAIYAPTDSINFSGANDIPQCQDTVIVNSPGITNSEIIAGCGGGNILCTTYYGCKSGACIVVSYDEVLSCSPNYCDPDCGGVDCALTNGQGALVNECVSQ